MRCQDILDKIEARYPRKYACDWDNVGLLAGSRELSLIHISEPTRP